MCRANFSGPSDGADVTGRLGSGVATCDSFARDD